MGSSKPQQVDVRLIACTNRDLKEMVDQREFREDLYYRLKVIEIKIPPLRDRQDDIPLLFDHFCEKYNASFKKQISDADESAMKAMLNYQWPGNVRELEHAIERAFILCHGTTIHLDHLPPEINHGSKKHGPRSLNLSRNDSGELLAALRKTGWNKTKAARLMGISRQTVYRKIREYNLKPQFGDIV